MEMKMSGKRVEDVQYRYMEARRVENTFHAMLLGRKSAEAICAELVEEVPDDLRDAYRKKTDLNARIGFLEDLVERERQRSPIPKAVLAGLRTLQAYGNYASHDEKEGAHTPPAAATRSAMASFLLVAEWFVNRAATSVALYDAQPILNVSMRDPELPPPRSPERRKILKGLDLSLPLLNTKVSSNPGPIVASLLTYYTEAILVCERICRVVIERETTPETENVSSETIPLLMEQIAAKRPGRVPLSVAADIIELWRRRTACERATYNRDDKVEPLLAELTHRRIIDEIVDWFQSDYLGGTPRRSRVERWVAVMLLILLAIVCGPCRNGWIEEGKDVARSDLADRYCNEKTTTNSICSELAQFRTNQRHQRGQ